MPKLPEPGSVEALRRLEPLTRVLPPGTTLVRIFPTGGPYPGQWNGFRYYGPTAARFDHHLPGPGGEDDGSVQERGVLYGAVGEQAFPTCLAEVFQGRRVIERYRFAPALVYAATRAPLELLDLSGTFATRIGASMAINSGPRPRARRWARRLYESYPDVHGIHYASSMHANAPAVALFERAAGAMPSAPLLLRALADPALEPVIRATAIAIGYECL